MGGGSKGTSSSYNVFMSFVTENGEASGILGAACYNKWLSTRKSELKQPEESFRRVLTAHVCGLIGRKPFSADIEQSLLRALRRKQVWPCFVNSEVTIGIKGFRKTGFHESRRGIFGSDAASSSLSPKTQVININPSLLASSRRTTAPRISSSSIAGSSSRRNSAQTEVDSLNDDGSQAATIEDDVNGQEATKMGSGMIDFSSAQSLLLQNSADLSVDGTEGLQDMVGMKRGFDSLDPLHIFNNSGQTNLSLSGLLPLNAKRLKGDGNNDQFSLGQLYSFPNMGSNFILTGFPELQMTNSPTTSNCTGQNAWPLS